MKSKILLAVSFSMLFSANIAFGQFHWNNAFNFQGSIETKDYTNTRVIIVKGTAASDRVEVTNLGGSALITLYSNGRFVANKLVRAIDNGLGLFPGDNPFLQNRPGKELWLRCELKGGNDHFECDSAIFDNVEISAGAGDDTILVGPTSTYVLGGDGRDVIYGGPQEDYLNGQDGNDFIRGGGGNDFIVGGLGSDFLSSVGSSSYEGSDTVYTGDTWFGYYHDEDDAVDYYWADASDELYQGRFDYGSIIIVAN